MKRIFALSLSLVAFSGGAGLGLSILHDYSAPVQTAMLTSPEIEGNAASGFVLPQYVPTVSAAAVTVPTLPALTAPTEPQAATDTHQRPRLRPASVIALATPEVAPTPFAVLPTARPSVTRSVQVEQYQPRAKAKARAPITYDAPTFGFIERVTPDTRPDYVVGVYR